MAKLYSDYIMRLPKSFKKLKAFLIKILPKDDYIVKEYKDFPYRIITSSKSNNLFKYAIVPVGKKRCHLLLKDLLDKDQFELEVHIKNIMNQIKG